MHSAGASFNPVETARLIQLTAEVMRHYAQSSPHDTADRASFLQTGSNWIGVLAIDNMSNWSRISLLTTELILNTMPTDKTILPPLEIAFTPYAC